jgi:hypothetical protein
MTYLSGLDDFVTDCSKFFSVSPGLKVYDISVNQKNMRSSRAKRRPPSPVGLMFRLHVAVKTGEEKGHPKIGKDDRTKSHNRE